MLAIALAAIRRRRSLVHTRFAPEALVEAVRRIDAEVLVARRLYMVESAIEADRTPPHQPLIALADVLESAVMRKREGLARPLVTVEAHRTWRDEVRCARTASIISCLSESERVALKAELARPPDRLDLVLKPTPQPAHLDEPIALFVGDLRWAPNRQAAAELTRVWPAIRESCPAARLLIVGRDAAKTRTAPNSGVQRLGFVDDLDRVWEAASVLLAPVSTGGGVRVKILDAARRGIPIVGSQEAVGSISEYLPVNGYASREEFIAKAAEALSAVAARRRVGGELYEASRSLSEDGFVERQVAALLTSARRVHAQG
jgi:hypothetical protein